MTESGKARDAEILHLLTLHLNRDALRAAGVSDDELNDFLDRAARALGISETRSRKHSGKTTLFKVKVNPKIPLLLVNVDGASKGNPGPSGIGVVISDGEGEVLVEHGEYIGEATNNVAEYRALLAALELASGFHPGRLIVRSDSELMVRQIKGAYRVKSPDLAPYFRTACENFTGFASWDIEYVPRAKNAAADKLANEAVKRHKKEMRGE